MPVLPAPPTTTPALYANDGMGLDAVVTAHYFLPGTGAEWFVTEYDPGERIAFGWAEVVPGGGELGYTSLDDLESVRVPLVVRVNGRDVRHEGAITVERDDYWTPVTLREAIAARGR